MSNDTSGSGVRITRLIFVPALITLAITILRLVGELQHWPSPLFNNSAGGGGAIVGISWLPFFFGPYFAARLIKSGDRPSSVGKTIGFALAGFALMVAGAFVAFGLKQSFPGQVLVGLLVVAAGGALQFPAWSNLARTLLAYAYAARLPVAIVMFYAIRGNWGTHYDALPPGYAGPMDFWGKYAIIGLAPQLVMWIVFTMSVGALAGGIAAAILKSRPSPAQTTA
jgi:hypothetical protein